MEEAERLSAWFVALVAGGGAELGVAGAVGPDEGEGMDGAVGFVAGEA